MRTFVAFTVMNILSKGSGETCKVRVSYEFTQPVWRTEQF